MKNKKWIFGSFFILILGLALFVPFLKGNNPNNSEFASVKATVYKTPTCGCCGIYANYFKDKGDYQFNMQQMDDLTSLRNELGIPENLRSCHTTKVGNYFVEGHIPLEAVNKMMQEKPNIAGIAMPGMPYGTPGMPGSKKEPWIIYSVNKDGSYQEYMRM